MKKSLVALTVLGAMTGLAHADDTNVTLYGVLDVGIATSTNVAGTAAVAAIAANPAKYQLAVPAVPAGTSGTVTGWEPNATRPATSAVRATTNTHAQISTAATAALATRSRVRLTGRIRT